MPPLHPLHGTRILSLALNLPGPAALLRCAQMGAECTKLEPLPAPGQPSADPMGIYSPAAYGELHQGVRVLQAHLKTDEGRAALHAELERTDVLITSFRPSALTKLGLGWEALQARYPRLSLVRIVGALNAVTELNRGNTNGGQYAINFTGATDVAAVASIGTPVALSLGTPAGTWLGNLIGWRASFGIMSALALVLAAWIVVAVPDRPGQTSDEHLPLLESMRLPGVRPVWEHVETWLKAQGGRVKPRRINTPTLLSVQGNPGIAKT